MRSRLVLSLACGLSSVASASSSEATDMATFSKRRIADLAEFPDPEWFANIQSWADAQKEDGTWSDVNYLSGCPAQRANWPIQQHWNRIITLAAAWSGASTVADKKWRNDTNIWSKISNGLDYWFKNDYEPADCMGDGGSPSLGCPCGTPGLWNTNWYDQAILIPQLSSTACLLVKEGNLSDEQRAGCIRLTERTYHNINGSYGAAGNLTAANIVLVLQSAVSLGLFTDNATIVADATREAFNTMHFSDAAMEDGIHRDGTFLQHDGILYNGNYGKDLLNVFIQLEGEAIGTRFEATDDTRKTMSTYIKGDEWMIFTDHTTGQQHWDYNVIGRFVSYPTQDLQASADINFNITKLAKAVADFDGPFSIKDTIRRLASNGTEPLVGNKGFWASDYMIHRGKSYTLANKMISTRSANSELVNGANTQAYHLGQGTLFSYVDGTEYKDIWASWDWNLIPGTTVVLNQPVLSQTTVKYLGKRDFVGVVSNGKLGAAVEDYTDPFDGHVSYKKAWFYLGDAVIVTVIDIKTTDKADGASPVVTVLDNRAKAPGGAFVDGKKVAGLGNDTKARGSTLLYGENGYLSYGNPFDLTLSEEDRTGNWSAISTSKAGVVTVPIFSAYTSIEGNNASYAMFPATTKQRLAAEAKHPSWKPIVSDGISGAAGEDTLGLVFWPGGANSTMVNLADMGWADKGTVEVTSSLPAVYLFSVSDRKPGRGMRLSVTAADPTQKLATAELRLNFEQMETKAGQCGATVRRSSLNFTFDLPKGGNAGSSVTRERNVDL